METFKKNREYIIPLSLIIAIVSLALQMKLFWNW
jgi:hypothetical protein